MFARAFMALSRRNRLLTIGVLCVAVFSMAMIGVEPEVQYSVDEILTTPTDHENSKVFVRGAVSMGSMDTNSHSFNLVGVSTSLSVDYSAAAVPDGFSEGLTISVRGTLVKEGDLWILNANQIQTGCPSKYEAQ